DGLRGGRRCLRLCEALRAGLVAPEQGRERAFALHDLPRAFRVVDHRLDLAAMAHDAFVLEQPLDVARREARDAVEIEAVERGAEVLALGEDRPPAQTGLETLEAELLEQPAVVADREAPFGVVIVQELGRRAAPAAARLAIGTGDRCAHGSNRAGSSAARQAWRPAAGNTSAPSAAQGLPPSDET